MRLSRSAKFKDRRVLEFDNDTMGRDCGVCKGGCLGGCLGGVFGHVIIDIVVYILFTCSQTRLAVGM